MRLSRAMAACAMAAALGTGAAWVGREARGQVREPSAQPAPGPASRPARAPGDMMSRAAENGSPVYVDDSFASVEELRKAINYAKQGQSLQAINSFQDIVDKFGQKLVYLDDSSYVSITDYVRERLLAMPAVKGGMYDQLFGGTAKKQIEEAIARGDISTLIRVCDRYFPSAAALKGLSQAAEWYWERGEFSAAARTWRELLAHPLLGKAEPEVLFRAAAADALAQNKTGARTLRDQLARESPEATGTVAGKEVKLLSRLDEILAMPPWEKVDLAGDEWPAFEGGPSHSRLLQTSATIGARLWSVNYSDTTADQPDTPEERALRQQLQIQLRRQGLAGQISEGTGGALTAHPVLSNGMIFVHFGDRLVAVSANAGTEMWSYPPKPSAADDRAAQAAVRTSIAVYGRMNSHDSAAVLGDQVFAVLPGAMNANNMPTRINAIYSMAMGPTRLVCLKRDTGQEIWSRSSDDIKLDKEGVLTFVGSPIVTRQGIFVLARKWSDVSFIQHYLVRLDRDTGATVWTCYLCSTSTGIMYGGNQALAAANVILPTLVDDILYVTTGQGADCAVDANVGRILWLRVNSDSKFGGASQAVAVPQPSWKLNPPQIIGDKMVAMDSGSALRVYNRWPGKLLRTLAAIDFDMSRFDVLAGVVGTRLIVTGTIDGGSRTLALDTGTLDQEHPTVAWQKDVMASANDTGKPAGRPFLSMTGYYIPFERKLVRIDPATGLADQPADWPQTESGEPGKPGNLLVTSEQVVVVNDSEVVGNSKWDTARDNRLAKIKADPKNPEPYLSLAEISFRTANHQDLAQEMMKQAVDLANAQKNPSSDPAGGILDRLYRTNLTFAELLLSKPDNALRDQSRFYYEQCKATARTPEQQAEWRLRLAELAQKQNKPDEMAGLYSEVLADPALRAAPYRDEQVPLQPAGSTAEERMKELIVKHGFRVYARFENQAAAMLQRAANAKDAAALQQVIDSFPNSQASLSAAAALAAMYQDKQDWDNARRVLWWLEPRASGEAQARAIANLVTVSVGLKKYPSALAWASRGVRQHKDYSWTDDSGQKMTFADLAARVAKSGGADARARLPSWPGVAPREPLDGSPLAGDNRLAEGQLLVPVETSPSLRPPNLLFIRTGDKLRVYDTDAKKDLLSDVPLWGSEEAVLLGATPDMAIILQRNSSGPGPRAIGVDLQGKNHWIKVLRTGAGGTSAASAMPTPQPGARRIIVPPNASVAVVSGTLLINGQTMGPAEMFQVINQDGTPYMGGTASDPEVMRRAAFAPLSRNANFSARIINGKLIVLSGSQLDAYDINTGEPAWKDRSGNPVSAKVAEGADGNAVNFIGNEDLIVVQVDKAGGKSSMFCVFDTDTGKARTQVKLDGEQAIWRGLADDGTLLVQSEQKIHAFDLVSEQTHEMWKNDKIGAHFASATALTLDGLIVVDDSNMVQCLAPDSGALRWSNPLPGDMVASTTTATTLRSVVDGDLIFYQSPTTSAALYTFMQPKRNPPPEGGEQLAWRGTPPDQAPPAQSIQLLDSFTAELLVGPANNRTVRSVTLVIRERKGGLMRSNIQFRRATGDPEGPLIRSWQVVDNGIAFDVGTTGGSSSGTIHFWRTKLPAGKSDQ